MIAKMKSESKMKKEVHFDLLHKIAGASWILVINYIASLFHPLWFTAVNIEAEEKPLSTLVMWQSHIFRKRTEEPSESNMWKSSLQSLDVIFKAIVGRRMFGSWLNRELCMRK